MPSANRKNVNFPLSMYLFLPFSCLIVLDKTLNTVFKSSEDSGYSFLDPYSKEMLQFFFFIKGRVDDRLTMLYILYYLEVCPFLFRVASRFS